MASWPGDCGRTDTLESVSGTIDAAGRGTLELATAGESPIEATRRPDGGIEIVLTRQLIESTPRALRWTVVFPPGDARPAPTAPATTAQATPEPMPAGFPAMLPVPSGREVLAVYEPSSPSYPLSVGVRVRDTSLDAVTSFLNDGLAAAALRFTVLDRRSDPTPYVRFEVDGVDWDAAIVAKPYVYKQGEVEIGYEITFTSPVFRT